MAHLGSRGHDRPLAAMTTPRAVRVTPLGEPSVTVGAGDEAPDAWRVDREDDDVLRIRTPDGAVHHARVAVFPSRDPRRLPAVEVVVDGWRFELAVEDEARALLRERASRDRDAASTGGTHEIRAIIPGRVVELAVAPGDQVEAGDRVLLVEAMKMQNELRAPRSGSVTRVAVGPGETVEIGDLLLVIE
jgi:biotin carboxyl carrier protein